VPGVSSALAGPAAAGIPVTHRGLAGSVTIATGHARGDGVVDHDWAALARLSGTLVFLMALETLEEIAMEGKAAFLESGGKEFHYIPTTNDTPAWMTALTILAMENLEGWAPRPSSKK